MSSRLVYPALAAGFVFACCLSAGALRAQTLADSIRGYVECYAGHLSLPDDYDIILTFDRDDDAVAATAVNTTYFRAIVNFDTASIRTEALDNTANLKRTVVHELWHVVLWEFAELAEDDKHEKNNIEEEERLISRIERWALWQALCR